MLNHALKQESLLDHNEKHRFFNDALDLFSFKKSGHMNAYAFNEPLLDIENDPVRGGEFWTKFIHDSKDYYLIEQESSAIKKSARKVSEILPDNSAVIELGPGEEKAVLNKSYPFISSLRSPKEFISIDVNSVFSFNAARIIKNKLKIKTTSIVGNFLSEKISLPINRPAIMTLFGGLLCNAGRVEGVSSTEKLSDEFRKLIKNCMSSGDYLVITQDANQDEESLMKAYSHEFMGKYILSVLHKIKRDLPIMGFNPDAFDFVVRWNPQEYLLSLNARFTEDANFVLGRDNFSFKKGQELSLVNSYKFPQQEFIKSVEKAGFHSMASYKNEGENIILHVLRVYPFEHRNGAVERN